MAKEIKVYVSNLMKAVSRALILSTENNLEVEVITSAMEALKENPHISIEQALEIGLDGWVIYDIKATYPVEPSE